MRIINFGHGCVRPGILRFRRLRRLAANSGQDAASGIEAHVEFAARVIAHDRKLAVIADVSRSCDYDLTIALHCYRVGLVVALANDGGHLALIAETLVKTPSSVIAQTREVIVPAVVFHGVARRDNFPVFLECHSRRVTAANADVSHYPTSAAETRIQSPIGVVTR